MRLRHLAYRACALTVVLYWLSAQIGLAVPRCILTYIQYASVFHHMEKREREKKDFSFATSQWMKKVSNQLFSPRQSLMLGEESAESEATLECLEEAAADGRTGSWC